MDRNVTASRNNFTLHPSARIGYVSLNVSDVSKSLDFYEKILGFKTLGRQSGERTLLSVDGHPSHLVELLQKPADKAPSSIGAKRAGLYHFAVLLPERKYLADMLENLADKRGQVHFDGLADHLVSESIYVRDPDYNGIEIYRDRPSSEWSWNGSGQVEMATIRLNTEELLTEATEGGWKAMPSKTLIGHVHLHVRDLASTMKFYRETLGLNFTATYPGAHFFAAGKYHHHIATNTWLGTGIQPASSEQIGLNHFGIELPNREEFKKTQEQVGDHEIDMPPQYGQSRGSNSIFVRDYDDITIRLYGR